MAVGRLGGLSPGVLSASVKGESWHHCSVPGSPSTLTPERTPVTGGARVWRGRGRVLPPPPCMARAWTSWTAPHWATWVCLHSDTLRIWGRESNPCSPRSASGAPAVAGTRRAYRAQVAASCRPRGRWCCCSCTGCRGMPRSPPRRAGPETSGARSRPRGPASGGAMLPLCRRKRKQTQTVVRASCWDKKHGGQPRGRSRTWGLKSALDLPGDAVPSGDWQRSGDSGMGQRHPDILHPLGGGGCLGSGPLPGPVGSSTLRPGPLCQGQASSWASPAGWDRPHQSPRLPSTMETLLVVLLRTTSNSHTPDLL